MAYSSQESVFTAVSWSKNKLQKLFDNAKERILKRNVDRILKSVYYFYSLACGMGKNLQDCGDRFNGKLYLNIINSTQECSQLQLRED